jgi:hypothetical protein
MLDKQERAEWLLIFKRIADALESIDGKLDKPKSSHPNWVERQPPQPAAKNPRFTGKQ